MFSVFVYGVGFIHSLHFWKGGYGGETFLLIDRFLFVCLFVCHSHSSKKCARVSAFFFIFFLKKFSLFNYFSSLTLKSVFFISPPTTYSIESFGSSESKVMSVRFDVAPRSVPTFHIFSIQSLFSFVRSFVTLLLSNILGAEFLCVLKMRRSYIQ